MENVFKIYDIRGIYPDQISERFAYDLGRGIVTLIGCKSIVIGRDMRIGSPELYRSLSKGVIDSGCDVYNIGVVSTPIVSFANTHLEADASVMITGSHHPKDMNGFKISIKDSVPLSQMNGLTELKKIVDNGRFMPFPEKKGHLYDKDIDNEYYEKMLSSLRIDDRKKFRIVCDYANSIGVVETYGLRSRAELIPLYNRIDSEFPNHDPDPTRDNIKELSRKVREKNADFGIALDGDADRIGFVDEYGSFIPNDLMISLLARRFIKEHPGSSIIYDIRCSRTIKEIIAESKGSAVPSRTGYPFIKSIMIKNEAFFGGELSGHLYFKENSYSESPLFAIIQVMNLLAEENRSLYELVKDIRRYAKTEEIFLEIDDIDRILEKLEVFYYNGKPDHTDGITLDFKDWWFNIRRSNTLKGIRLNIEAKDEKTLKEKKYDLLKTIEKISAHEI